MHHRLLNTRLFLSLIIVGNVLYAASQSPHRLSRSDSAAQSSPGRDSNQVVQGSPKPSSPRIIMPAVPSLSRSDSAAQSSPQGSPRGDFNRAVHGSPKPSSPRYTPASSSPRNGSPTVVSELAPKEKPTS